MPLLKALLKALLGEAKPRSKAAKNIPHSMVIPHYKRIVVDGKEYLVKEILSIDDDKIVVLDIDNVVRVIKRRKRRVPY